MTTVIGVAVSPYSTTATDPRAAIGLLRRLRSGPGRDDPYPIYARLRALGRAIPTPWGGLLLPHYDECARVIKDRTWLVPSAIWRDEHTPGWRSGLTAVECTRGMLQLDPPEHTWHRQAAAPRVTRRALDRLAPAMGGHVDACIDALTAAVERDGRADFAATVAHALPAAVMCELIGLPVADGELLRGLVFDYTQVLDLSPTPAQVKRADQAARTLGAYMNRAIEQRRREPRDDLLTDLIRAQDDGSQDEPELARAVATVVLVGGQETVAGMLSAMVVALAAHRDQADRLAAHLDADPDAVPDAASVAVEELLRWDAPLQMTHRVAGRDTDIGGLPIPRGTLVHLLLGSAQRDDAVVSQAERLDLRRTPATTTLAFGGGIHYCLGAALARMLASLFLPALLRRCPPLRAAAPPHRPPGVTFRSMTSQLVEPAT
ncbi:cytochrome P450 [Nonomuraea sp. NPDC050404]|uniref:cytochrome P450 n=1 Tax=Nonomuraea sp. NPDC050404 TaxID=3155783 RepID=UPI0033C773BD